MNNIKLDNSTKWWLSGFLTLTCLSLWLSQGLLLSARNYFFDDLLYLRLGNMILNGQWLGAFDETTLVKGPGYPLWIVVSFLSGLPLLLSQNILYVSACSLLIYALLPFAQGQYTLLSIMFCVLLFDPQAHSANNIRVFRDFLYSTQHILIFACLIGMLSKRGGVLSLLYWALGLGICLTFFWITREENFLILPSLFMLLAYTGWKIWRENGKKTFLRISLLVVPLAILAVAVVGLCALNNQYYGISEVVEQNSSEVNHALDALKRVKQAEWHRYIPLPKEVRDKIYLVSPAFAELKPFLEGPVGEMWTRMSTSRLPELLGKEDIGGGWYLWALRDSIKGAGYYRSGTETINFYSRLASEVNAACDNGGLDCNSAQFFSIFRHARDLFPHILRSLITLAQHLASYEQNQPIQQPSLLNSDDEYVLFLDISLNNVAPPSGQTLPTMNQNKLNHWKIGLLQKVYDGYRLLIPVIYGMAGCCLMLVGGLAIWSWSVRPLLIINLTILATIIFRLLGLAYIDATACSAKPYLGPLYPLAIISSFLLFMSLSEQIGTFKKRFGPGRC